MADLPRLAPAGSVPPAPSPYLGLAIPVALVFGCLVVGGAASQGVLAGAAALAAVAVTLLVLYDARLGALCLVGVVPIVSGLKRGLPVPGLRLSELMIGGVAVLILLTAARGRHTRWGAFDWAALAYVVLTFALGGINTLARGDSLSADDVGKLVGPLQFFLLYRATLVALPGAADRRRALDLILVGGIAIAAITLLQTAKVPGVAETMVWLTGEDYSDKFAWSVTRATGPFPHWTMLSGYLMAVILLAAAPLLDGEARHGRALRLTAAAAASAALLATVTIAAILGTIAGVLALAWWYRKLARALATLLITAALLGAIFAPLLSQRADEQLRTPATSERSYALVPASVSVRLGYWTEQYFPALSGRWLAGYGPQVPPEITWQHSESIYISLLMRGGLVLLAAYGALMWALGSAALRRARSSDGELRSFARLVFVLVALLAVVQANVPYFTTNGLPHLFWIFAALLLAASPERQQAAAQAPRRPAR